MDSFQLVNADHLDLLVSAAAAYGQLLDPTTAAFSPTHAAALTTASPDEAGQLLLEENLAAVRWRSNRGRGRLPTGHLVSYRHRPVTGWEPVEVIKAVHAYDHATAESPGWAGSAAHRLTSDVAHAAAQRLPGYAEASWWWHRREPATVLGVHSGGWCPDLAGVAWVDLEGLLQRWEDPDVVAVLTVQALEQLPADLVPRTQTTYLLARPGGLSPAQWTDAVAHGVLVLVELPTGKAWLEEQLARAAGTGAGADGRGDWSAGPVDHTRLRARRSAS